MVASSDGVEDALALGIADPIAAPGIARPAQHPHVEHLTRQLRSFRGRDDVIDGQITSGTAGLTERTSAAQPRADRTKYRVVACMTDTAARAGVRCPVSGAA